MCFAYKWLGEKKIEYVSRHQFKKYSDFVKKFNSGQVDVIAAPAYAYKPLEISKGMANGALFNFPAVNITGDLIIKPGKFPANFGTQSRQWFINKWLCCTNS